MIAKEWSVSDTADATGTGDIEFQDRKGEHHHFDVIETADRLVFGGACNAGFLESGYIEREEGEPTHKLLEELLADLEAYYNDGPDFTSRIVCNERM